MKPSRTEYIEMIEEKDRQIELEIKNQKLVKEAAND